MEVGKPDKFRTRTSLFRLARYTSKWQAVKSEAPCIVLLTLIGLKFAYRVATRVRYLKNVRPRSEDDLCRLNTVLDGSGPDTCLGTSE